MDRFHVCPFCASLTLHLHKDLGPWAVEAPVPWVLRAASSQCCFSCSSILGILASGSLDERLYQSSVWSLWQG